MPRHPRRCSRAARPSLRVGRAPVAEAAGGGRRQRRSQMDDRRLFAVTEPGLQAGSSAPVAVWLGVLGVWLVAVRIPGVIWVF